MTPAMRNMRESSQVAARPMAWGNEVASPERATPCSASFHQLYSGISSRSIAGATSCIWRSRNTTRSEEHTSELQSLAYLVCRLLLEKTNYLTHHLHTMYLFEY